MHAMVNLSLFDRTVSTKIKLLISALLKFLFGSKCLIQLAQTGRGKQELSAAFNCSVWSVGWYPAIGSLQLAVKGFHRRALRGVT